MNDQRKPYTADEIQHAMKHVPEDVRNGIVNLIIAYLMQYETYPEVEARIETEKFLPVVLTLMEDAMRTGAFHAEEQFTTMIQRAIEKVKPGMAIPKSVQN